MRNPILRLWSHLHRYTPLTDGDNPVEETNNATERVIGWSIKEQYRTMLAAWLREGPAGRDMSPLFVSQIPGKKPGTSGSSPLLPALTTVTRKLGPSSTLPPGRQALPGTVFRAAGGRERQHERE